MLIESTVHLPTSLAMFDGLFHEPDVKDLVRIFLRWSHFVAGVLWIGLLYFFNLVNVPLQKALDADTKKKVNPKLLGDALWYFRWGAVVTVLAGFTYFAMYILAPDDSSHLYCLGCRHSHHFAGSHCSGQSCLRQSRLVAQDFAAAHRSGFARKDYCSGNRRFANC